MNYKKVKNTVFWHMILLLVLAVLVETAILNYANRKQVNRTSKLILDQVETILTDNEQSEEEILASLKEEYVEKAYTVAYMLDENQELSEDITELHKIAELMSIDEIHLFDQNGRIYAGTVPAYYGLDFSSGEQIGFFKPMLEDKNLTMCQDVTPNTAEEKSMMYAICWDKSGTYMVQVGIEPVRLLQEFKRNNIYEVVRQMPVYEGMNIYIADVDTGIILGSSDVASVDSTVFDVGFVNANDDLHTISSKSLTLNGYRNYCNFRQYGSYFIAVVHSTKANLESFKTSIGIELIWLLVAGGIIVYTLFKLFDANKKIHDQISILESISDIYYSMHLIDMSDYSIEEMEGNDLMKTTMEQGENASDMLQTIVDGAIEEDYREAAKAFADMTTLSERLKNKNSISMDALDKFVGWLRMSFISVEQDEDGRPQKVILTTQIIDEDKKREEELTFKANRDEMTGLLNRRAYEDDLLNYPDVPPEENFVYAAIDINGLKVVNDSLGHAAGDDLIIGAARCLKRTLGNYGRVYRTGGDEFVSIFFADRQRLEAVLQDLEMLTVHWQGAYDTTLSVSVGYATKAEFAAETVLEMAQIADKRMYEAKERYYSQKGIDRRGQAAAHTALCNLYTKILKINLTQDSFSIVNMETSEQTKEKGFSSHISEWLSGFGNSGQVHKDDLAQYLEKTDIEYLKKYFRNQKTSISIHYRRMIGEDYKQVVMEMIPAQDYSDDNQSLFLYVKEVDR